MFNLLRKDFNFTKKWIFFAVLYAVIMIYVSIQEDSKGFFIYFLIPFFCVLFPLGKIMSMEDNEDTRDFLRRLPQPAKVRVLARVLYVFGLLVISMIIIIGVQMVLTPGFLTMAMIQTCVIVMLAFMFYFMIQLAVFYYKSYHLAQHCLAFVAMGAMGVTYLMKRLSININISQINITVAIVVLLILNLSMYKVVCWCEMARKN